MIWLLFIVHFYIFLIIFLIQIFIFLIILLVVFFCCFVFNLLISSQIRNPGLLLARLPLEDGIAKTLVVPHARAIVVALIGTFSFHFFNGLEFLVIRTMHSECLSPNLYFMGTVFFIFAMYSLVSYRNIQRFIYFFDFVAGRGSGVLGGQIYASWAFGKILLVKIFISGRLLIGVSTFLFYILI